jgi:hypothetical protein
MHMSQHVRVADETRETKCCNIIKTTTHVACNIQHQEPPPPRHTNITCLQQRNSTSPTLKFNVCNTQQHASAKSKLGVCNSETSESTFATSRLIHMQHVSEIVTTSQHLDHFCNIRMKHLQTLFKNIPNTCNIHFATAPKLCLLATMTAARSSAESAQWAPRQSRTPHARSCRRWRRGRLCPAAYALACSWSRRARDPRHRRAPARRATWRPVRSSPSPLVCSGAEDLLAAADVPPTLGPAPPRGSLPSAMPQPWPFLVTASKNDWSSVGERDKVDVV